MTWVQYWSWFWKDFEVSMAICGAFCVLAALGFAGYLIYDKIQDWRGN
jgi:hypothetical protein